MVHGIAKLAVTGRSPFSSKNEALRFANYVIDNSLPTGEVIQDRPPVRSPRQSHFLRMAHEADYL